VRVCQKSIERRCSGVQLLGSAAAGISDSIIKSSVFL